VEFNGFPEQAFAFFEAVEPDVDWSFVRERRQDWERFVHEPMEALLEALAPEFGDGYAYHLHRDPWLWRHQIGVVAIADTIALQAELSMEGLRLDGGWLRSSNDQVVRYREAVDDEVEGADLGRILQQLLADGFAVAGETLKTGPRGILANHPRIGLLRQRSLIASRWAPPDTVATPLCEDEVRAGWRALRPLTEWFAHHVGPRRR
jgi:uncharacterized protein (DUF2461 family)